MLLSLETESSRKWSDRAILLKNTGRSLPEWLQRHLPDDPVIAWVDAFEFLQEWPKNRRGPIFDTALRPCQRAYDGQVPISVAREAFAGFARSAKILEDVSAAMPWMTAPKTGRGGVTA